MNPSNCYNQHLITKIKTQAQNQYPKYYQNQRHQQNQQRYNNHYN